MDPAADVSHIPSGQPEKPCQGFQIQSHQRISAQRHTSSSSDRKPIQNSSDQPEQEHGISFHAAEMTGYCSALLKQSDVEGAEAASRENLESKFSFSF
jgi:hypothetical protein